MRSIYQGYAKEKEDGADDQAWNVHDSTPKVAKEIFVFETFRDLLEHAGITYHQAPILGKVFGQRCSEAEVLFINLKRCWLPEQDSNLEL